jgi:hypothetical protein
MEAAFVAYMNVLTEKFNTATGKTHEKSELALLTSEPRIKPGTCRIQRSSVPSIIL